MRRQPMPDPTAPVVPCQSCTVPEVGATKVRGGATGSAQSTPSASILRSSHISNKVLQQKSFAVEAAQTVCADTCMAGQNHFTRPKRRAQPQNSSDNFASAATSSKLTTQDKGKLENSNSCSLQEASQKDAIEMGSKFRGTADAMQPPQTDAVQDLPCTQQVSATPTTQDKEKPENSSSCSLQNSSQKDVIEMGSKLGGTADTIQTPQADAVQDLPCMQQVKDINLKPPVADTYTNEAKNKIGTSSVGCNVCYSPGFPAKGFVNVRLAIAGSQQIQQHSTATPIHHLLAPLASTYGAMVAKDGAGFEIGLEVTLGKLPSSQGMVELFLEPDDW